MGLEITAGVTQCIYWHLPVYSLAFGLGFSGVCIHLQIFSFFHKAGLPLSKTRYVLARFLNGLLSAAFYLLLSYFLPANTSVAVETSPLNTAPMTAARHHPWRSSRCLCSFFSRVFSAAEKHRRKFVVEIPPGKCYNENNSKSNLKIGGDESVRTQKEKTNTRSVWQPH